jgi:antitoxin VapB
MSDNAETRGAEPAARLNFRHEGTPAGDARKPSQTTTAFPVNLLGVGPGGEAPLEIDRYMAYAQAYAGERRMTDQRHVKLFRNGRNQAVRIPVEFELPGNEAIMHRDGDRLVLEPVRKRGLLALLDTMEPFTEPFPDIDEGLSPLRDVKI